jgi:hypothetical protein
MALLLPFAIGNSAPPASSSKKGYFKAASKEMRQKQQDEYMRQKVSGWRAYFDAHHQIRKYPNAADQDFVAPLIGRCAHHPSRFLFQTFELERRG